MKATPWNTRCLCLLLFASVGCGDATSELDSEEKASKPALCVDSATAAVPLSGKSLWLESRVAAGTTHVRLDFDGASQGQIEVQDAQYATVSNPGSKSFRDFVVVNENDCVLDPTKRRLSCFLPQAIDALLVEVERLEAGTYAARNPFTGQAVSLDLTTTKRKTLSLPISAQTTFPTEIVFDLPVFNQKVATLKKLRAEYFVGSKKKSASVNLRSLATCERLAESLRCHTGQDTTRMHLVFRRANKRGYAGFQFTHPFTGRLETIAFSDRNTKSIFVMDVPAALRGKRVEMALPAGANERLTVDEVRFANADESANKVALAAAQFACYPGPDAVVCEVDPATRALRFLVAAQGPQGCRPFGISLVPQGQIAACENSAANTCKTPPPSGAGLCFAEQNGACTQSGWDPELVWTSRTEGAVCAEWRAAVDNQFDVSREPFSGGDLGTCKAGVIDPVAQADAIRYANMYRRLAGLRSALGAPLAASVKNTQAAALMMAATNEQNTGPLVFSHNGDDYHTCVTTEGKAGVGTSNLIVGTRIPADSVGAYVREGAWTSPSVSDNAATPMDESFTIVERVGHRRGVLARDVNAYAFGQFNTPRRRFGAMRVDFGTASSTPGYVAFPGPAAFPLQAQRENMLWHIARYPAWSHFAADTKLVVHKETATGLVKLPVRYKIERDGIAFGDAARIVAYEFGTPEVGATYRIELFEDGERRYMQRTTVVDCGN